MTRDVIIGVIIFAVGIIAGVVARNRHDSKNN